MTKIYRDSFRFFLSSLPLLLTFAAMIEGNLWVCSPGPRVPSPGQL